MQLFLPNMSILADELGHVQSGSICLCSIHPQTRQTERATIHVVLILRNIVNNI